MNEVMMNSSGYRDPTAYQAMMNMNREAAAARSEEVDLFIKGVKTEASRRGLRVIGRIGIQDIATGKKYL